MKARLVTRWPFNPDSQSSEVEVYERILISIDVGRETPTSQPNRIGLAVTTGGGVVTVSEVVVICTCLDIGILERLAQVEDELVTGAVGINRYLRRAPVVPTADFPRPGAASRPSHLTQIQLKERFFPRGDFPLHAHV